MKKPLAEKLHFYTRLFLSSFFLAFLIYLFQKPVVLSHVVHSYKLWSSSTNIQFINAETVHKLRSDSAALLIDTRSAEDFSLMHIPGARLWSDTLLYSIIKNAKKTPKQPVILYCSAGCERSKQVADAINEMVDVKLLILFGGMEEWLNAGFKSEELP